MNELFVTTMPYDDEPQWRDRAEVVSRSRARLDLEASRDPVRPGCRHLVHVLRALASGRTTVLYSACPANLEFFALIIARLAFRSRVGHVLFTGDMWEPASGLRLSMSRILLRLADGVVDRWVVHTRADVECFVDIWGIEPGKIELAPFGYPPDWAKYEPWTRDRPYVFAGGNTHRDFGPILEAAGARPHVDFVLATSTITDDDLPPNVELVAVDRPTYQGAMGGATAVVVPLRPGLRRSVGQQTYLHAMRAGKVTIVPRSAGVGEYVTTEVDGLIVDGTAEGYVQALDRVLDPANREWAAAMGERAAESAIEHPFSVHPRRIVEIVDGLEADDGRVEVTMLMSSYLPVVGGAQRQLAQLLPLLEARSIQATVVARGVEGSPDREKVAGGSVVRIPITGSGPQRSVRYTLGALAELRRQRPDVIHSFDLLSPTTTALVAKLMLRVPLAAKVLRGGRLGDLDRLRSKPFGSQRLRLMRRLLDRVVVISDEIDRELRDAGFAGHQLVRIVNGVDVDHFAPLPADRRAALRRELDLGEGPVAVFTGRLDPEKRVDLLLSEWNGISERTGGSATLLIIGDGPEETSLRERACPGVRFVGRVDDVAPYLQVADAFVLPSETEGLSNSLLEAMAIGTAVIVTKVGGAAEVIEHFGNGMLIPPGDGAALGEALDEVLGDPELRAGLGAAARQTMIDRFSLEATADRLGALYGGLAKSKSGLR